MKNIKKILFTILLCMPLIFVSAKEKVVKEKENDKKVTEENVEVINNASYGAGATVNTKGNFFGSAFYAGDNLTSDSNIDGIGFLAANNITVNGSQDYLITAGNVISINGIVENDAFIAGNKIDVVGDIKRDAYIAGSIVTIKGNIDRNVKIYAPEVNISGHIIGNVEITADTINISDTAIIDGYLKYNDNANIIKSDVATISEIKTYTLNIKQDATETLKSIVYNLLTDYINLLIVALVITYLLPKVFVTLDKNYTDIKVDDYFRLFAKGMIFLILIPLVTITLLLSSVGFALGIIGLVIYFVFAYISIILTGYIVGNLILTKLFKKESNKYINILIGIGVIKVLELIPYLGGIVSIVSLFIGLGIVLERVIFKNRRLA